DQKPPSSRAREMPKRHRTVSRDLVTSTSSLIAGPDHAQGPLGRTGDARHRLMLAAAAGHRLNAGHRRIRSMPSFLRVAGPAPSALPSLHHDPPPLVR